MVFQMERIVRDVHTAIDENRVNLPLLDEGDMDTLSLEDVTRSKVEESARRAILAAPVHLLDGGVLFGDTVYWLEGKKGCGWIPLGDDFLRLVVFRMSDWERPVYDPVSPSSLVYALQSSRHSGVRGNPQKPVVAVSFRSGRRVLEFWGCRDERATVDQARYMALPVVDGNDGIAVPELCYRPMIYIAASLVLLSMGEAEASSLMLESGKQLLV